MMIEKWMCLDCSAWTQLNKHGRCSTCGSDAVLSGESHRPMEIPVGEVNEIRELYRILAL